MDSGSPANASYDFIFTLYDDEAAGSIVAGPLSESGVAVSEGLFTVELDFGAVYDGDQRWLEIQVSPAGAAMFEALSPRQQLAPAAYALYSVEAGSLAGGVDDADADPSNETNTRFELSGTTLELEDADGTLAADLSSLVGGLGDGHSLDADDGDPVDALYVDADGNVGVNTTAPAELLHASGGNVLQTPGGLALAGSVGLGANPSAVAVSGRYAYVVDSNSDALRVMDVSDPSAPAQISSTPIGSASRAVAVSGRYVYALGTGGSGLKVVDVSNPFAPVALATLSAGGSSSSVAVSGRYVYALGTGASGLRVVDVSDPSNPVQVGSAAVSGSVSQEVAVSGRYAYVLSGDIDLLETLEVFDVSDPSAPALAGTFTNSLGSAQGMAVSGRYAYLVNVTGDVKAIDVSDPANPVQAGILDPSGVQLTRAAAVSGRYLYTVGSGRLRVFDLADPTAPVFVASLGIGPFPESVAVSGRYAYVVDSSSDNLRVIDVSGGEFSSLMAHSLEAGSLQVRDGIIAQRDIQTMGGLAVGQTARIDGDAAVNGTVTAEFFAGDGSLLTNLPGDGDADSTNEIQDLASVLGQGNDAGGAGAVNLGNVGVGTPNPATGLHTLSAAPFDGLTIQTSDNNASQGILFRNAGANYTWTVMRENVGANEADFVISGDAGNADPAMLAERLRIDRSTGLVTAAAFAGDGSALTNLPGDGDADSTNELQNLTSVLSRGNNAGGNGVTNLGNVSIGSGPITNSVSIGTSGIPATIDFIGSRGADGALHINSSAGISVSGGGGPLVKVDGAGINDGAFGGATGIGLEVDFTGSGASNNYAAIFQGGSVGIGTETPTAELEVVGVARLSGPASSAILDQAQEMVAVSGVAAPPPDFLGFQTFTAGLTGTLESFDLFIGNGNPVSSFDYEVRQGAGTGGALLASGTASAVGVNNDWLSISPPSPPSLASGSVYSIVVSVPGPDILRLGIANGISYPDGSLQYPSAPDPMADLAFRTFMRSSVGLLVFSDDTVQSTAWTGALSSLDASDGSPANALAVDAAGNVDILGSVDIGGGADIAGDVGIGTSAPDTRLDVEASKCCNETLPDGNTRFVANIVNTNTNNGTDVLWLEVQNASPNTGSKFINFVGGGNVVGSVSGNGGGGVSYTSAGGDYAEWLPRLDPAEEIGPGDVVGVFGGLVSKSTDGADWTMAVSTAPNTLGNTPRGEAEEAAMEKVAFLGQAPVKVAGPVMFGDYIVASGRGDGTAIAVAPGDIKPEQGRLVVGRAWEASRDQGAKLVNTAVGIPEASSTTMALARRVDAQQAEIAALRSERSTLKAKVADQEARLARLEALLLDAKK